MVAAYFAWKRLLVSTDHLTWVSVFVLGCPVSGDLAWNLGSRPYLMTGGHRRCED